ncbi:hypothetical protein G8770_19985 [Aestuariicella hydrocarbonica]|uniref:ATP synthase subunit b n=1 Tax=Pseudomaricurvus hydrocarbonicus TaxID=1470433 RepID=A0A9E5T4A9_9GAMM|nr:F0F1 ATP synthase subunit delta [Aestuariicella hydrocarbonica]NHO67832.1 hypothetical protein [Aestuariicella hydrocarbonica]
MELNWTTFALEILNFLVLLWLLKRFLYKPVMGAVEKRRAAIEQDLASANEQKQQAEALLQQQQRQLAEREHEQQQAKLLLQKSIDSERKLRLAALDKELDGERERRKIADQHQRAEALKRLEQQAIEVSAKFCARLLSRFSGAELESLIIQVTCEELNRLPSERKDELKASLAHPGDSVAIRSAYPMCDPQRQRLAQTLSDITGNVDLQLQYIEDAALISGVHILAGPLFIQASLANELHFFTEVLVNDGGACQ